MLISSMAKEGGSRARDMLQGVVAKDEEGNSERSCELDKIPQKLYSKRLHCHNQKQLN